MSGESGKKPKIKAIHPTLIFVSVLVLHVAAILLFTRGFLLARTELPFHSDCSDVSSSPCFGSGVERGSASFLNGTSRDGGFRGCWTKPVVGKIVIVVLDALRFDFVAPSSFFEEKKPWMDKLQVLQKLTFKERSRAMIFKAIADPPTTSLQRLKGLTIGGLPTFVDIGNSFGTPALSEDNLINQLIENGKRVVMMGDDTWVQLFPHHFVRSYPLPSFNVKDLDTVDNGCIEHLFPSLYEEDWDVLIAHFLGMDHAGHIFGVDSAEMIRKLEQYNSVLEKVIEVLESQSGPGGLHENTLLLVMGDHGQTLNGDHGGGSAEEVETAMFAMSLKRSLPFIPPEIETPHEFDSEKRVHISSFQQLDFAVTVSALLGIPFPFGSIGRVNLELYALAAGNWNMEKSKVEYGQNYLNSERWLHEYVRVLCTNAWQILIMEASMVDEEFMSLVGLVQEVKRYIDIYSASSLIGFSSDDVSLLSNAYVRAEEMFLKAMNALASQSNPGDTLVTHLKSSIDAHSEFLARVSELAHSKWTEFKLGMMGFGLGIMLFSLLFQYLAIRQVIRLLRITSHQVSVDSGPYFGSLFACFLVGIHAMSLLSNSYLVEEAKVATFLLATAVFIKFKHSMKKMKMLYEAGVFLFLILTLRFAIYLGLSKQAGMTTSLSCSSWIIRINEVYSTIAGNAIPIVALILLAYILYRTIASGILLSFSKAIVVGAICCYVLIAVHWASESSMSNLGFKTTGRTLIPRIVYAIGFGELLLLAFGKLGEARVVDCQESLFNRTVCMLCTWSSTIILLSGKQGPLIALASIIGGYCIVKLQNAGHDSGVSVIIDPLSVVEWSLLAVIMFFSTGHWCAFDGLRYGAAFVGFDEFALVRQAILLTTETFGFSHIIPVFGLPFLILGNNLISRTKQLRKLVTMRLTQVYLMYGLIMAATVTVTIICVTIQRRHLMVWALFAPKFVFDVVGLILADILICLASLYYHLPDRIERLEGPTSKIMNNPLAQSTKSIL